MALVKCKECRAEISSSATACPKCGKPQGDSGSGGMSMGKLLVIGIGLLVVFMIVADPQGSPPAPKPDPVVEARTSAVWACREAVRRQLKDRDSGKFELPEDSFAELKGDTWHIQIDGKAKNTFGAVLDHTWDCSLKTLGKDFLPLAVKEIR